MQRNAVTRFLAALVALLWLALPLSATAASTYGKKLLLTYDLPQETVDQMNRPSAPVTVKPGESHITAAMMADSVNWSAPEFKLSTGGNPYTTVIHATVTVLATGDAASLWEAGWNIDGAMRGALVTGLTSTNARAGQKLALVGAATPITFKEDRTGALHIGLKSARNVRFEAVRVDVWSGIGSSSWVQRLGAFSPVLIGVVMLGLFFWFRRS